MSIKTIHLSSAAVHLSLPASVRTLAALLLENVFQFFGETLILHLSQQQVVPLVRALRESEQMSGLAGYSGKLA